MATNFTYKKEVGREMECGIRDPRNARKLKNINNWWLYEIKWKQRREVQEQWKPGASKWH